MSTTKERLHPMKKYKGTVMWEHCEIEDIENLEVRPDDVFVATFPRSGTTLTQELTYLIMTKDFETAEKVQLEDRCTYMDYINDKFPFYRGVKHIQGLPKTTPRIIKTHLHYSLLPKQLREGKGRIVHLMRNPKDAMVSLYKLHKSQNIIEDDINFNDFFERFLIVDKGSYPILSTPWPRHVKEYWAHRNDPNMLLLRFEDVVKDKPKAIRSIASFLGQSLNEDEVEKIADHCSLENMKQNPMTNLAYWNDLQEINKSFGELINQGGIGTSKDWFTPDMNRRMNEMVQRELEGTGLDFPNMH